MNNSTFHFNERDEIISRLCELQSEKHTLESQLQYLQNNIEELLAELEQHALEE